MTNYRSDKKDKSLKAMQDYHRKIKKFSYVPNSAIIMEIGAGKLNDIHTWIEFGIKRVIALEFDKNSIERGNSVYNRLKKESQASLSSNSKVPDLDYVHCDLTDSKDIDVIIRRFHTLEKTVNQIYAHFCIHFFLENKEKINGIMKLVKYFLKPGGSFKITTLDGSKVYNILSEIQSFEDKKRGGKITNIEISDHKFNDIINVKETKDNTVIIKGKSALNDQEVPFFKIQRLYPKDEKFKFNGQLINVYIISIGMYHNEYLVNVDYLIEKCKKFGLNLKIKKAFHEFNYENSMTEAEKQYSNLEVYLEFLNSL